MTGSPPKSRACAFILPLCRLTVVNEWNTGFTASFAFKLPSQVSNGWVIILTFSKPAQKLQTWVGDIKSVSPDRKRYVVTNIPWQKQLNAGYKLKTDIVLTKAAVSDAPAPTGVAVFQRLNPGTGGNSGGGGTGGGTGGNTGGGGGVIQPRPTAPPAPGPYNYNEVLRKSILFYEAQRSGRLPATNRIPRRKSANLRDDAGTVECT